MYFKNLGRSKRTWDKYVFSKPAVDFDKVQHLTQTQIEDVDKQMDKELNKYLDDNNKEQCNNSSKSSKKSKNSKNSKN